MKKLHFAGLLLITLSAKAQTLPYKPFKVNISLGFAQSIGKGLAGGTLYSLEPKYAVGPRTDMGVRVERALLARGVLYNEKVTSGTLAGFGSVVLTATHLFSDANTRPFAGVGLGLYAMASAGTITVDNGQTQVNLSLSGYRTVGGLIRVGLKSGHFVFAIEYNTIPPHTYTLPTDYQNFRSKSSYIGFKLGGDLGGGPTR